MPEFNLTQDEMRRLEAKFKEFKQDRETVHELINHYIADYRQFEGNSTQRYEHLRKKYISRAPSLSHLVSLDGSILWSVSDISIILNRHRTAIRRTLLKFEQTEGWRVKLMAIRETAKAPSGLKIQVYHQEIFDLILDLYEEEYLLRFSEPRRGDKDNAPDINEVKRFWKYLKDFDNFNKLNLYNNKKKIILPDVPPMRLKEILSLTWLKVFNIKIGTVCSLLFAICFETARRFLGINIYLAAIPALIFLACIILIYFKKFSAENLSTLGAGALLFALLWVSASLSVNRLKPEPEQIIPDINITPYLDDFYVNFTINSNVKDIKEYFYRVSPDKTFKSTGVVSMIKDNRQVNNPSDIIINKQLEGLADIDVKFTDINNNESNIFNFKVDINAERFKLYKEQLLKSEEVWVYARYYDFDDEIKFRIIKTLFSHIARSIVDEVFYSVNNNSLDQKINYDNCYKRYKNYDVFDPYTFYTISGNDDSIKFIYSRVLFKDGSSSDIYAYDVKLNKKIPAEF